MQRLAILVLAAASAACGTAATRSRQTTTHAGTVALAVKEAAPVSPKGPTPRVRVVIPRPGRSMPRLKDLLSGMPWFSSFEMFMSSTRGIDGERPLILAALDAEHVAYSFGIPPGSEVTERERFDKAGLSRTAKGSLESDQPLTCEVTPSFDGLRGTCVRAEKDEGAWEKLSPLALVPEKQPSSSDIHVEFQGSAFTSDADSKKEPKSEDQATNAFNALFEGLLADVDHATLDFFLEGTPEVRIALSLLGKNVITRAALDAPTLPPPPSFLRLPQDSEIAVFAHGPTAQSSKAARDAIFTAMESTFDGCAESERARLKTELEALVFTGGSVSFAQGYDRARAEDAARALVRSTITNIVKKNGAGPDPRAVQNARSSMVTWSMVALEEPADRWKKGLAFIAKNDCKSTEARGKVAVTPKPAPRFKLPAGTMEIVTAKGAKGRTPAPPKNYVFIVPDGERTFIAFGNDEAQLVRRLKGSLDGTSTLATRLGDDVTRAPAAMGGFVTSSFLAWNGTESTASVLFLRRDASTILSLAGQSTGGRTPIPMTVVPAPNKGGGGELRARARLDGAALSDLSSMPGRGMMPKTNND